MHGLFGDDAHRRDNMIMSTWDSLLNNCRNAYRIERNKGFVLFSTNATSKASSDKSGYVQVILRQKGPSSPLRTYYFRGNFERGLQTDVLWSHYDLALRTAIQGLLVVLFIIPSMGEYVQPV